MHVNRSILCVMWKDKCSVLLLPTHAPPISTLGAPLLTVPCQHEVVHDAISTSPVLLEYTTYMYGIDVVDQLWACYSSEIQSHK